MNVDRYEVGDRVYTWADDFYPQSPVDSVDEVVAVLRSTAKAFGDDLPQRAEVEEWEVLDGGRVRFVKTHTVEVSA